MRTKFGLNYKITIQIDPIAGATEPSSQFNNAIVIEPPFTIDFNIHRSINATVNSMVLKIYNLSKTHQSDIFQDRFNPSRKQIRVEMGYLSTGLSTVFVGDIFEANSAREGTDIITTIDARDGYFDTIKTIVNVTMKKDQTLQEIIIYLAQQFPNTKIGNITDSVGTTPYPREFVLEGNVYKQIEDLVGANPTIQQFIDLEVINIVGINEVVINPNFQLLDASTGLIQTPRRDQSFLTVRTLLEPRIIINQNVTVKSEILTQYNGNYKVLGITHRGIISGSVESRVETMFSMNGNQLVGGFKIV